MAAGQKSLKPPVPQTTSRSSGRPRPQRGRLRLRHDRRRAGSRRSRSGRGGSGLERRPRTAAPRPARRSRSSQSTAGPTSGARNAYGCPSSVASCATPGAGVARAARSGDVDAARPQCVAAWPLATSVDDRAPASASRIAARQAREAGPDDDDVSGRHRSSSSSLRRRRRRPARRRHGNRARGRPRRSRWSIHSSWSWRPQAIGRVPRKRSRRKSSSARSHRRVAAPEPGRWPSVSCVPGAGTRWPRCARPPLRDDARPPGTCRRRPGTGPSRGASRAGRRRGCTASVVEERARASARVTQLALADEVGVAAAVLLVLREPVAQPVGLPVALVGQRPPRRSCSGP